MESMLSTSITGIYMAMIIALCVDDLIVLIQKLITAGSIIAMHTRLSVLPRPV